LIDPSLQRIEDALEKLAAQQADILARLVRLEESGRSPEAIAPSQRSRLISFLDQFRAGEALGETSLGAWIAVCKDSALRGGLRVVQSREASHARLLAERIKELGDAPSFEIPDSTYEVVMRGSANTETSDLEKVSAFVSRFPDAEQALAPIHTIADRLEDDPETQALLRAIADDERATLEFFYTERERMAAG